MTQIDNETIAQQSSTSLDGSRRKLEGRSRRREYASRSRDAERNAILQMNGTLESGKKLVQALQEAKVDPNTGG
jgi:ClpP class serine protease